MASTLTILTVLPAVAVVAIVACTGPALRPTSLRLAWGWALVAGLATAVTWLATNVSGLLASPWDDIAWYAVAELLLCPPIAVLGARRPGVAVWNWFVLLPLILVLGWPVATAIAYGAAPGSFTVDTPLLLGMLLVLVMGCGNYLGTRFQASAVLLCLTVLLLIAPLLIRWGIRTELSRLLAVWSLGAAALAGWIAARQAKGAPSGPDRVWLNFRDLFGIVWARRVQERVNEQAQREDWKARLESRGFVDRNMNQPTVESVDAARIDHTLRWLLRRFVDDAWIDRRLGAPSDEVARPRDKD